VLFVADEDAGAGVGGWRGVTAPPWLVPHAGPGAVTGWVTRGAGVELDDLLALDEEPEEPIAKADALSRHDTVTKAARNPFFIALSRCMGGCPVLGQPGLRTVALEVRGANAARIAFLGGAINAWRFSSAAENKQRERWSQ
jgi:hypothetical protein